METIKNINQKLKNSLLIIIIISASKITFAQKLHLTPKYFDKVGFITGVGNQGSLNVNYAYQVKFFQLQYYKTISRKNNWEVEVLLQPQINKVEFGYVNDKNNYKNSFETGLNFGMLLRKNFFNDFLSFYGLLSLGPHYISGAPQRQSEGFIFSDNLFVGMNLKVKKDVYLDFRPGFRHISNAGLQKHNGGINTFVFSEGLMVKC